MFQLMALFIEANRGKEIPESYFAHLPTLLQPTLWESSGNVPALVRLLSIFLQKDVAAVQQKNYLPGYLGVWQKLINSKLNDGYGFELLEYITYYVPW